MPEPARGHAGARAGLTLAASPPTLVMVNPVSAGGRTMRRWPQIRAALDAAGIEVSAQLTAAPGAATRVTREVIAHGEVARVVAVGGDGTLNEVVNGCFDEAGASLRDDLTVGLIPSGTGSDLRRTLGLPTDPQAAARLLAAGTTRTIDLGRVDFGDGTHRLFVNVASCGLGAEVVARVERRRGAHGGLLRNAVFLSAGVAAVLTQRNREVLLTVDGEALEQRVQQVVIANGRCFGGGMRIAPSADPTDGLLDLVVVGDISRAAALAAIPRLYRGTHLTLAVVETRRARSVAVAPVQREEPLRFELDGEAAGRAPAEISVLPRALRFAAP